VAVLVCGKPTSRGTSGKKPKREGNQVRKSWVDDLSSYHELKYGHSDEATRVRLVVKAKEGVRK
jgi:hypothetical protein